LVDASEELLTGIRGGGGAFGVIVELKIKVYALKNVGGVPILQRSKLTSIQILAGLLIMDAIDIGSAFTKFCQGQQDLVSKGLPTQMSLHPLVVNTPRGKLFAVQFVWASEDEIAGRSYLAQIASLGNIVMNTVSVTTVAEVSFSRQHISGIAAADEMLVVFKGFFCKCGPPRLGHQS